MLNLFQVKSQLMKCIKIDIGSKYFSKLKLPGSSLFEAKGGHSVVKNTGKGGWLDSLGS